MSEISRIKLILDTKGISISTAFSSPVSGAQKADAVKDLDLLLKEVEQLRKENEELRMILTNYESSLRVALNGKRGGERKEIIEKLEQVLDILYNE